jgi:putative transposase
MSLGIKQRKQIRLKNYDYSQHNAYFITICVNHRKCILSNIIEDQTHLSHQGKIIEKQWLWLAKYYPYVSLNEYVIMPNHFHGIVVIENKMINKKRYSLSQLICAFKTTSAKAINKFQNSAGKQFWQRSYHERVIRNEEELGKIQEYIINNPLQWAIDEENPQLLKY